MLKINFGLDFQIAITWKAIKWHFHHIVDFAKSIFA